MQLLLQADLDGELAAAEAARLAAHVAGCAACAGLQEELAAQSVALRGGLTRYTAPAGLRRAVIAAGPAPRRRIWGYGASFGAGAAMAAAVALVVVLPGRRAGMPELVGAHIRALQPGHLVDVGSSDQHTVKPWFDGRLDYAPPVRDFSAQGYPLVGGRLDVLGGRPVAALVYRRDKHVIDVFVWPDGRVVPGGSAEGYNVVGWAQGGMNFKAVSDLNMKELGELAALLQSPGG